MCACSECASLRADGVRQQVIKVRPVPWRMGRHGLTFSLNVWGVAQLLQCLRKHESKQVPSAREWHACESNLGETDRH